MSPLNLNVKISNRIDLIDKVVRGLWWKNDLFSDLCPCYASPELTVVDLKTSVENEWMVRKTITEKHLKALRKAREAYKQELIQKQKEAQEKAKNKAKTGKTDVKKTEKKKGGKKPKKGKVKFSEQPIPPIVDEATYIDVNQEYEELERSIVEREHEDFAPENLQLGEHEVNLREYHISNGVFKIECFERPSQTVEVNQQLFLRLVTNPNTINYHRFHHVYQPVTEQQVLEARKTILIKSPSVKLAEDRERALGDLVKVEIKLSDKLYWWECPLICRWEPWEESNEFKRLDPEIQDYNLNHEKIAEKESHTLFSAANPYRYRKKKYLKDFDLTNPPMGVDRYDLAKYYLVPMMPIQFKFFQDQLEIFEKKQREWKNVLIAKNELENAKSFDEIEMLQEFYKQIWQDFEPEKVTIEEFNKFFDARFFEPRNLFPVEHKKIIEALEDAEIIEKIAENREKLLAQNFQLKDSKDVDIGEPRPVKNEPKALSEFLQQVEKVKQNLRPFIWNVEVPKAVEKVEKNKKRRKTKSKKEKKNVTRLSFESKKSTIRRSVFSRQSSRASSAKSAVSVSTFESETTDETEIEPEKIELTLVPHVKGKWSTRDIYETKYDQETKTVTFYSGSLGTFGLAVRKYCNFPLVGWEIFPVTEENEKFVFMKISIANIVLGLKITGNGITLGYETKKGLKMIVSDPLDFEKLKKVMISMNLNIFPEADANWYVNGNSEKHLAMEFHTYKSMAACCLSHHFKSHELNRFATARIGVLNLRQMSDEDFTTVMVTPLKTASVIVNKKSNESESVELEYQIVPEDQEFQPDLLSFLKSQVNNQQYQNNSEKYKIIWLVQSMLFNVRPLSFS